ncbi:MAG TPA: hypothetical protein V6C58_09440 [Allocoleopsis sp.]
MAQRWTDEMLDKLGDRVDQVSENVNKVTADVDKLTNETKELNVKFTAYQQSTQWVVQLAFSLIASATITVIITSIFRR